MSEQPDQNVTQAIKFKRAARWSNAGMLISTLALATFVICFGYGYYELSKVNVALAGAIDDLQMQTVSNHEQVSGLEQALHALGQSAQRAEMLAGQQDKMMAEWRAAEQGNLSRWYVAEALYLVRLADDQIQFSQNTPLALALLQHAEQTLANVSDPRLMPVREALVRDIEKIRSVPEVDVSKLFLVVNALDEEISNLPMPARPLQPRKEKLTWDTSLPWWDRGMQTVWQTLQRIIIVHYDGSNQLPLILPEEKPYLMLNMHGQMQMVMWALLNHDAKVYQTSLTRMINWIPRYFDMADPATTQLLIRLRTLQAIRLEPPLKNISGTVSLLNQYLTESAHHPV